MNTTRSTNAIALEVAPHASSNSAEKDRDANEDVIAVVAKAPADAADLGVAPKAFSGHDQAAHDDTEDVFAVVADASVIATADSLVAWAVPHAYHAHEEVLHVKDATKCSSHGPGGRHKAEQEEGGDSERALVGRGPRFYSLPCAFFMLVRCAATVELVSMWSLRF